MAKAIVEHGLRLPIHRMMMEGTTNKGRFEKPMSSTGSWRWTSDGEIRGTIGYAIHQTASNHATLDLSYTVAGQVMNYAIQLVAEPCRFGGWRWFAFCPHTGRKACKLYLPNGGKRFLSRKAYSLAYRSQCDAAGFDRTCNQRNRILARKLKGDDPQLPLKPKWMRLKTYEHWLEVLDGLESEINTALVRRFKLPLHLMPG